MKHLDFKQRATGQRAIKKLLRISKKLSIYTAACGMLWMLPQLGQSQVTTYIHPGGTVTIDRNNDEGISVDMNDDDMEDFFLIWNLGTNFFEINGGETNVILTTYTGGPTPLLTSGTAPLLSIGGSDVVDMIPPGTEIDPSFDLSKSSQIGEFSGFVGERGYVAVKFGIQPDLYMPALVGYLDVGVNSDNNLLTLYGGAFHATADTEITTPSVPEPGSIATLALGCLAAATRRRRKKLLAG